MRVSLRLDELRMELPIVETVNVIFNHKDSWLRLMLTNVGLLSFEPLGTNFSEIWIEILTFSFKKVRFEMSENVGHFAQGGAGNAWVRTQHCSYGCTRGLRYWHQTAFNWKLSAESLALMKTSLNGNIFRVTGPLCGDFTGEFPSQRPVTRSFDAFFDLRLNKRFSKPSRRRWFETP